MTNKITPWLVLTVTLTITFKVIHAQLATSDLYMVIVPTSLFVESLFNTQSIYSQAGAYFPALNIVIDKSCSGINFFIIAFCTISTIYPYNKLTKAKAIFLYTSILPITYILTIIANTCRITTAIFLLQFKPTLDFIDQHWVHEAEGVFVYLSILLTSYLAIKHLTHKLTHNNAQHA